MIPYYELWNVNHDYIGSLGCIPNEPKTTFPTEPLRGQHQNIHWNPWIFVLCTQLTPFKTIWTNFIIVSPIDSFQDHMTWFLYCVPNWLLSRPFELILSLCIQLTPLKTIWPESIVYTIIKLGQMVLRGVKKAIRSNLGTQYKNQVKWSWNSQLGTQCKNQLIWSWKESIVYTIIKLGQMVLKGISWVHNTIRKPNGLWHSWKLSWCLCSLHWHYE